MSQLTSLRKLVRSLRDPEQGCPWAIQQDFSSLVPFAIEEAFEVGACVESDDFDGLVWELGDLLYQIVFYCQIAEENEMFDMDDVVGKLETKLRERHPHVFAGERERSVKQKTAHWNETKRAERRRKLGEDSSELDDVPRAIPSLTRAQKVQKRASLAGFDWKSSVGPRAKIGEELGELDELLYQGDSADEYETRCREELGDILFSVVNLARHLGIDPEYALTNATDKFINRFQALEVLLREEGKVIEEVGSADLEKVWQVAKKS